MSIGFETLQNKNCEENPENFFCNQQDLRRFKCGHYILSDPTLLKKPENIPSNYIAYNPSAIWTTMDRAGNPHDIMYARVEPRYDNHLGVTESRPYEIFTDDLSKTPQPYDEAEIKIGEDPALTRVNRLVNGKMFGVWLMSCVKVIPSLEKPGEVESIHTEFYEGEKLSRLEKVAEGPTGMKDIRISPVNGSGSKIHVYGRPQTQEFSGNITHTILNSLDDLCPSSIANANYIDENLLRVGSGIWGGANDIFSEDEIHNLILAHRAWRTGKDGLGRHYEAVFYRHNLLEKTITDLGYIATADLFPELEAKSNGCINLRPVFFPGGGKNGKPEYLSGGVGDSALSCSRLQKAA